MRAFGSSVGSIRRRAAAAPDRRARTTSGDEAKPQASGIDLATMAWWKLKNVAVTVAASTAPRGAARAAK
ncbi:MAG: hypothetical protein ABSC90_04295 [Acidimicrobiales bacterium]